MNSVKYVITAAFIVLSPLLLVQPSHSKDVQVSPEATIVSNSDEQQLQHLRQEIKELRTLVAHIPSLQQQQQHIAQEIEQTQHLLYDTQGLQQQEQARINQSYKDRPNSDNPQENTIITTHGAEVKLYGFVRMDTSLKFKGIGSAYSSITAANRGNDRVEWHHTLATTRLGVDFSQDDMHNEQQKKLTARIEGDFYGAGERAANYRLRQSYISYDQWLVGQTWSIFNDINVFTNTLSFNYVIGHSAYRVPMIRYRDKLNANTHYAIALEKTRTADRWPTLVGRMQYHFTDKRYMYAATRIYPVEAVRLNQRMDKGLAWSALLSGVYDVNNRLRLMSEYRHIKESDHRTYRSNAPSSSDGLQFNEVDSLVLGAVYKHNNKLTTTLGYGYVRSQSDAESVDAMFSLAYQWTPKITSTLGYGYSHAKERSDYINVLLSDTDQLNGERDEIFYSKKQIHQGYFNVRYMPINSTYFSVEAFAGQMEDFDGKKAKDERLRFIVNYNF
ncbi:MAG: DcaP family trimeric outer membrane transporter [Acinetobacter sp.]|nr:DcaP family trimeric outer membrane transporter [Acinetobacter sp.]